MHLAQVSKRTSVISQDYSLCNSVNFKKKKVPAVFLQQVINRKCKFLGLQLAKVEDTLNLRCHSELKGLDISNCQANDGVLEELIGSCQYLEKIVAMNYFRDVKKNMQAKWKNVAIPKHWLQCVTFILN